ncbi:MAG: hypothetical protein U1F53_03265 [Burkholderiaceae bacterium]
MIAALACSATVFAATDATKAVVKAIEAKDCPTAVKELNTALATSAPDAWLLGGAMFEQGLCLKQNVDRASRLYLRAAEAGRVDARSRLVALYALPAAGPDKAAALWWAQQAALPMPAACGVPSPARDSADAFAQALAAWPPAQLDACVYVAGVVAAMDAEFALQPDEAAGETAKDKVLVDFQPAAGRVVVSFGRLGQQGNDRRAQFLGGGGLNLQGYAHDLSPDQMRAMQTEAGKQNLADLVDSVAQGALARFPKPGAIDAAWRVRLRADGPRAP